MENQMRYLARFVVETNTPLSMGSGRGGLLNQRLVAKDANGLPYIPGTALAGVVRHELEQHPFLLDQINHLFGYQTKGTKDGLGSRITFSSGHLLAEDGQTVLEGLRTIDFSKPYFTSFKRLPERDHVRITDRGVAKKHGKFEEELVHKGTRFVFELEMEGSPADTSIWQQLLNILNSETFRIGAGTRKGFGQLKVLECQTRQLNLSVHADLMAYLAKSSSLNAPIKGWDSFVATASDQSWLCYTLEIKASDFFLSGAGLGDEKADIIPKKEKYFVWESEGVQLKEHYLLPATSLKGAVAHRVAYHYNRLKNQTIEKVVAQDKTPQFNLEAALETYRLNFPIEQMDYPGNSTEWQRQEAAIAAMDINNSAAWQEFIDNLQDEDTTIDLLPVGESNEAVRALFGYAKTKGNPLENDQNLGARGKVVFSDIYLDPVKIQTKTLNHVALDRFTGGARDGALFTQEVSAFSDTIELKVYIEDEAFVEAEMKTAFEKTLDELCSGQLQLGGSVNKGHGVFTGSWNIETKTR